MVCSLEIAAEVATRLLAAAKALAAVMGEGGGGLLFSVGHFREAVLGCFKVGLFCVFLAAGFLFCIVVVGGWRQVRRAATRRCCFQISASRSDIFDSLVIKSDEVESIEYLSQREQRRDQTHWGN